MDKELTTTKAVVEALGGASIVADMTGRGYTAVWNWMQAETFPSNTYLLLNTALLKLGKRAPASLWKMTEPVP